MHPAHARYSARPSILVLSAGGILGLVTVVLSAANAISTALALALATTTGLTIVGALLGEFVSELVPELRTAWQRGFQQGFEAGMSARSSPSQEAGTELRHLSIFPPRRIGEARCRGPGSHDAMA